MSRKIARELLFKLAFESELKEVSLTSLIESFIKREKENILEKFEIEKEEIKKNFPLKDKLKTFDNSLNFLRDYSLGIDKYNVDILSKISEKMEGWTYERIGNVEKVLLKTAIFELTYKDTPKEVVLNEHIEIAKKYGDTKSYEFINGVLAKFV